MTNIELGVPHLKNWTQVETDEGLSRTESRWPADLSNFTVPQPHLILVRNGGVDGVPAKHAAMMNRSTNVITLVPRWWRCNVHSLRDLVIESGSMLTSHMNTMATYLLYELTHSKDVFYSHVVIYGVNDVCDPIFKDINVWKTKKAEDNADNWAIYFTMRVLLTAYPEPDIFGSTAVETRHFTDEQGKYTVVQERDHVLHCCILFSVLCHPEEEEIRDRVGDYNVSLDRWAESHYPPRPETIDSLLTIPKGICGFRPTW